MAGRLVVSTLNNDTGVLNVQNGMTGIAKAWVNFNGVTTTTIRDSFNVSSVTRSAAGIYTVNFTTAMPNANYSITNSVSAIYATGSGFLNINTDNSTAEVAPTTTAFTIRCGFSSSGATSDLKYINISVFSS